MEEVGVSDEEGELIDSLFYRCDATNEGEVYVNSVIQYLKNCLGNGNNEPDLLILAADLESDSTDGKIPLQTYRQVVRNWILDIRSRRDSTSFLEPDGPVQQQIDMNTSNNNTDVLNFIETSGIGDGSIHTTDQLIDLDELHHEIEDLKFQNRRLVDEAAQMRGQLEIQEEVITSRSKQEEHMKKKIKSLQEMIELRQTVMEENEELKAKLLNIQEVKREQDSKILTLERENHSLEHQMKDCESKWQKTCSELESAQKELQHTQTACLQQKHQLLDEQVLSCSNEDLLEEKTKELNALQEKCNQLLEQNGKLHEEKEDVQVTLAQMHGKLQRFESQAEEMGLGDGSLVEEQQILVPGTKHSPKLRFSTPLRKHSICMELKERLNEDRHLPSPLCEKHELSHNAPVSARSALLPTYMSAWDLEISNTSLQDYSLELLRNRKLQSPDPLEIDKKLASLKDLEKDALQKEIIKLYRVNLDLAEKCHKAELKESELREKLSESHYHHADREKLQQSLESVEGQLHGDLDLKDLWRLVHSVDEESAESDCSLSVSTEALKHQIRSEIEALRIKINKRDTSLVALKTENSRLLKHTCKGRSSLSPLVDALNIEQVKIRKASSCERNKSSDQKSPCQCSDTVHQCNKSVPLTRISNRLDQDTDKLEQDIDRLDQDTDSNIGDRTSECIKSEQVENTDEINSSCDNLDNSEPSKMRKRFDIPERFKPDSFDFSAPPDNVQFDQTSGHRSSYTRTPSADNNCVQLNSSKDTGVLRNEGDAEFKENYDPVEKAKRDIDHALLRRDSYKAAIDIVDNVDGETEMPTSSTYTPAYVTRSFERRYIHNRPLSSARTAKDEFARFNEESEDPRSRRHSFKYTLGEGQISQDSLSSGSVSLSTGEVTPEYESSESLSLSSAPKPKYSSTPLPTAMKHDNKVVSDVLPDDYDNTSQIKAIQGTSDTGNRVLIEMDLFKSGGINFNKMSPCTSNQLSILMEEEVCGGHSPLRSTSLADSLDSLTSNKGPSSTHTELNSRTTDPDLSSRRSDSSFTRPDSNTSMTELNSSPTGPDCSVEAWTLSNSDEDSMTTSESMRSSMYSRDSGQSRDSGHSSTLESFQKELSRQSSVDEYDIETPAVKDDSQIVPVVTNTQSSAPNQATNQATSFTHSKKLEHKTRSLPILETSLDITSSSSSNVSTSATDIAAISAATTDAYDVLAGDLAKDETDKDTSDKCLRNRTYCVHYRGDGFNEDLKAKPLVPSEILVDFNDNMAEKPVVPSNIVKMKHLVEKDSLGDQTSFSECAKTKLKFLSHPTLNDRVSFYLKSNQRLSFGRSGSGDLKDLKSNTFGASKQLFSANTPPKVEFTRGRTSKNQRHDYYNARNLSPSERILLRSGDRSRDRFNESPIKSDSGSARSTPKSDCNNSLNDSLIMSMENLDISELTPLSDGSISEVTSLSDGSDLSNRVCVKVMSVCNEVVSEKKCSKEPVVCTDECKFEQDMTDDESLVEKCLNKKTDESGFQEQFKVNHVSDFKQISKRTCCAPIYVLPVLKQRGGNECIEAREEFTEKCNIDKISELEQVIPTCSDELKSKSDHLKANDSMRTFKDIESSTNIKTSVKTQVFPKSDKRSERSQPVESVISCGDFNIHTNHTIQVDQAVGEVAVHVDDKVDSVVDTEADQNESGRQSARCIVEMEDTQANGWDFPQTPVQEMSTSPLSLQGLGKGVDFNKTSEKAFKKPHVEKRTAPVKNGNMNGCETPPRTKHLIICDDDSTDGGDMGINEETDAGTDDDRQTQTSFLSKIRENHLAKRRDYTRQNKMPQLSELAEKDALDNNNEPVKPAREVQHKDNVVEPPEPNGDVIMPSIPDEFLNKLALNSDNQSSEELSDQEIESKFTSLSLAFKTDSQTLEKRLEIQERSRDIAEQNVDKELQGLRSGLETLNQICTDPQVREVLTKIQNHIDILEKSTARVSSRAEVFGAIQQEKRMSKAVDIMVHHVENLRRVHEREHAELEEARKLLQDSRSLAPSTIDLPGGGDMLSRRSASVCQNNLFTGKLSPVGAPTSLGALTPSTAKAIKLLKASRRRVSEIALPKVLGGSGAPTLHPSSSMDFSYMEPRALRSPISVRADTSYDDQEGNIMSTAHNDSDSAHNSDPDARSRFQAAVAHTTVKSAVASTLRRASLEKQNHVQSVSPSNTPPQVSRDNSTDSAGTKITDAQDKEKQKNAEEDAFKKGYEQGLRANLGQDLSGLREQQNHINESLGEIMDSIDSHMEEPKSLKEIMVQRLQSLQENIPKFHISGWRIRMTMGCFFIVMAVLSIIVSLFPVSSAKLVGYRHYGGPPV